MSSEQLESGSPSGGSGLLDSVRHSIDKLSEHASVERVYGDPIDVGEKTIIPVARVSYGFGGGFGSGSKTPGNETESEGSGDETDDTTKTGGGSGKGGGGGGGLKASPVGVFEVTDSETRFVGLRDWKRLLLALGVGVVCGYLLRGRPQSSGTGEHDIE